MAGRTRRKKDRRSNSMASYKPPLVFTESPIEGKKFYCTPVQAARRPYLAPSVPVDQDASCKWVSPQFDGTISTSQNLKASRQQKKGKHHKENVGPTNRQVTNSSLPALEFLNGKPNTRDCCGAGARRCSQRLQEKNNRTHFLFEKTDSWTPSKIREMKVLAYETPEHDMPKSRVTYPMRLWANSQSYSSQR